VVKSVQKCCSDEPEAPTAKIVVGAVGIMMFPVDR
jgi:hypothetical protein